MANGTASETNGITSGTNGSDLLECPHCGSVAEYVSEHAKGKRWAVACTMTSKVAADEGRPMCRCRTPFVRDKGQARDIWNRRTAVADHDFAMAVHDGERWGKCSECKERQGHYLDAETIQRQQEHIAELERERDEWQLKCCEETGLHASHVFRRDALIRDLYDNLWTHQPKCAAAFTERMRDVGIDLESEGD